MHIEEIGLAVRGLDCPTGHRATAEVFDCARERALQALEVMTEIAGLRGQEPMTYEGAEYFVDVLESFPDGLRGALFGLRDSVRV